MAVQTVFSKKFYEMYDEVKKIFYNFHFLSFFYRFKSNPFNIDYINYNFILLVVKKIKRY